MYLKHMDDKKKKEKKIDLEKIKKQQYERALKNAKKQIEKNKKKETKEVKVDLEKIKKQQYERALKNAKKQIEKNKKKETKEVKVDLEKIKKQQYERTLKNAKKQIEKNKKKETKEVKVDLEKIKKQQYERALKNVKKQIEKKNICLSEGKAIYSVKPKKLRVNKRSIYSEFTLSERKAIYERDMEKCILCSSKTYLGIAHIFVNRSKGGKGVKENGVLLCQNCHNSLDNGKDSELRNKIQEHCEKYLKEKYGDINVKELIYDKNRI